MNGIILAGGFGTRLASVVSDVPKPMAPVSGKPFLEHLLDYLDSRGFRNIVLSVGYKHEIIREHFGDRFKNIGLFYAVEDTPLGTGGGIRKAVNDFSGVFAEQSFFIVNGDTFFRFDPAAMLSFHDRNRSDLTIALKPMRNFDRYGTITLDENGRITDFLEKKPAAQGLINAGIYLTDRRIFSGQDLPDRFSFEKDIMEKQLHTFRFYGTVFDEYFVDIGIPEDYAKANLDFEKYEY